MLCKLSVPRVCNPSVYTLYCENVTQYCKYVIHTTNSPDIAKTPLNIVILYLFFHGKLMNYS